MPTPPARNGSWRLDHCEQCASFRCSPVPAVDLYNKHGGDMDAIFAELNENPRKVPHEERPHARTARTGQTTHDSQSQRRTTTARRSVPSRGFYFSDIRARRSHRRRSARRRTPSSSPARCVHRGVGARLQTQPQWRVVALGSSIARRVGVSSTQKKRGCQRRVHIRTSHCRDKLLLSSVSTPSFLRGMLPRTCFFVGAPHHCARFRS